MSSYPHEWSLSFFSETIFNLSIPWEVRDGKVGRSRCLVFSNMSKSHKVECEQTHGWRYDDEHYSETIVTQVCIFISGF